MHYIGLVFTIFVATMFATAEEKESKAVTEDPFAGLSEDHQQQGPKLQLRCGTVIPPHSEWHLQESEWPNITAPTIFNRYFERPFKVWRFDGGYFASFNAGEFGGALFFAQEGTDRWMRIMDAHVQSIAQFSDGNFLAAGGIAHLESSSGTAYLLKRRRDGIWKARKVFESDLGVPELWGVPSTVRLTPAEDYATIRLNLLPGKNLGVGPVFAITASGVTVYIGEEAQNNSEQSGGGRR